VQSQNALSPMEVTEIGSTTDLKLLQKENAFLPIEETPWQMTTDFI